MVEKKFEKEKPKLSGARLKVEVVGKKKDLEAKIAELEVKEKQELEEHSKKIEVEKKKKMEEEERKKKLTGSFSNFGKLPKSGDLFKSGMNGKLPPLPSLPPFKPLGGKLPSPKFTADLKTNQNLKTVTNGTGTLPTTNNKWSQHNQSVNQKLGEKKDGDNKKGEETKKEEKKMSYEEMFGN
ncbi:hypothetical protein DRH14_04310 [Candidatus Shapirobacteria bacterium]|nr:MAG: hypothetical protein DRH14_04310 [Candidatus Shapirobacteria bacterium]